MAQGKILRLQRQPGSEARPRSMKQDANDRFHGMARLPAEATNRNDLNVVGIIGMHAAQKITQTRILMLLSRCTQAEALLAAPNSSEDAATAYGPVPPARGRACSGLACDRRRTAREGTSWNAERQKARFPRPLVPLLTPSQAASGSSRPAPG
jgi:hypothetical protein